jgi:AcrR family transcriptional regulator
MRRVFFAQDGHAVGVDMIIADSGVAKMTLYRYRRTT